MKINWPFANEEIKKFLPMAGLVFLILFNYNLMYNIRDSLVMPILGVEAFSFLEFWITLPAALILTLLYIKLVSSVGRREFLFHFFTLTILSFFLLFAFVIYPNINNITLSPEKVQSLINDSPHLKWPIIVLGNWPYALFNIFVEFWVNLIFSLLFWQLANSITLTNEAKRFYPLLGFMGNVSLIFAGSSVKKIATNIDMGLLICVISSIFAIIGFIIMLLYHYVYLTFTKQIEQTQVSAIANKKLSVRESIEIISKSRYLWCMAALVVCYGVAINASQAVWKAEVAVLYPSPEKYTIFMADYQNLLGIISVCLMILGSFMIRRYSWILCSLVAPVTFGIVGIIFFVLVSFTDQLKQIYPEVNYIHFAVIVGMLQVIFAKATKYSFFDATKEMAYIPLAEELKTKGKAAVDILGERFGKAGSAFMQTAIFSIMPLMTYQRLAPFMLILFMVVILTWIYSVKKLSVKYNKLLKSS